MGRRVRARDLAEVLEQALLGRLVVVRRHLQRAVGPGLFGAFGEVDRLAGGVAARAGEHLDPARAQTSPTAR